MTVKMNPVELDFISCSVVRPLIAVEDCQLTCLQNVMLPLTVCRIQASVYNIKQKVAVQGIRFHGISVAAEIMPYAQHLIKIILFYQR